MVLISYLFHEHNEFAHLNDHFEMIIFKMSRNLSFVDTI